MKSPSKKENNQDDVVELMNSALEHSVQELPEQTLSDIAKVRATALKANQRNNENFLLKTFKEPDFITRFFTIAVPSAAVVVIALSVNNLSMQSIPELPSALISGEVPSEDLAMLEDMEFVAWLAENETNNLL